MVLEACSKSIAVPSLSNKLLYEILFNSDNEMEIPRISFDDKSLYNILFFEEESKPMPQVFDDMLLPIMLLFEVE